MSLKLTLSLKSQEEFEVSNAFRFEVFPLSWIELVEKYQEIPQFQYNLE